MSSRLSITCLYRMLRLSYRLIEDKWRWLNILTRLRKESSNRMFNRRTVNLQTSISLKQAKMICTNNTENHSPKFIKWSRRPKRMTNNKSCWTKCGTIKSSKILNLRNTIKSMNSTWFRKMLKILFSALWDRTSSSGTSPLYIQTNQRLKFTTRSNPSQNKKVSPSWTNHLKNFKIKPLNKKVRFTWKVSIRFLHQKMTSLSQNTSLPRWMLIREDFFLKNNCWTTLQKVSTS